MNSESVKYLSISIAAVLLFFLSASVSYAKIKGEAEVGYSAYDSTYNSVNSSSSSFYHRYSLLQSGGGSILGGKAGSYGYALGYEWGAVDFTSDLPGNDKSNKISTGHLLYAGDIILRPRDLPVMLKAYSRDLSRLNFEGGSMGSGSDTTEIISPSVNSSISNGTRTTQGFTLIAGIKDDSQLTRKALIFRDVPRFVLDYKSDYLSNLKADSPEHSMTQEWLASLNKGPAWLVYRTKDSVDYIQAAANPGTDAGKNSEKSFSIGTVSAQKERLWINLTNWIAISSDAEFSKFRDNLSGSSSYGDSVNLNMFMVAERANWSLRNYNTFNRGNNSYSSALPNTYTPSHSSTIPVYLQGKWNIDTDWQTRFQYDEGTDNYGIKKKDILSALRVQTFKRSPFSLTPSFSIKQDDFSDQKTTTIQGRVETSSSRRFSDVIGINASYDISNVMSQLKADESNQLQQTLSMRVNYKISEVLRAEFSQKNSLFSGKSLTGSSSQESSGTATSQYGLTPRSETGSESYRSLSTAKLAWLPLARLKLSVDLTSDYYKEKGVDPDLILTFGNSIDYTISNYSIKANTRYSKRNTGIYNQEEMTEDFTASYAPNRSLQSSINGEYSRLDDNGKITTYIQATQRIAYTINRSSINKAKLLDIIEETTVSRSGNRESTGSYPDRKSMSLRANYYPTKNLFLGASSRYSLLDPGNVTEWFASSNVGFNYNKLQTTVEYAYGKRNGGTDNRIEKKISANLKKQF